MTKILILIQIGSCIHIDNLMSKILKYNNAANMFLFSIDNSLDIDIRKYNILNCIITNHYNVGMDIGPYILQIEWILKNLNADSYDYIYKIHTKTDQKWFNELTDIDINIDDMNEDIYMNEKWKFKLDNLNRFHINRICAENNINNIYYDKYLDNEIIYDEIDEKFYSEYYNIELKNCDILSNLLGYNINRNYIYDHSIKYSNIINAKYISIKQRHNIYFCAGSIFIIKYEKVYSFFQEIDIRKLYSNLEPKYSDNTYSTYVHALERIISSFFL